MFKIFLKFKRWLFYIDITQVKLVLGQGKVKATGNKDITETIQ